jgi:hypothetical protein
MHHRKNIATKCRNKAERELLGIDSSPLFHRAVCGKQHETTKLLDLMTTMLSVSHRPDSHEYDEAMADLYQYLYFNPATGIVPVFLKSMGKKARAFFEPVFFFETGSNMYVCVFFFVFFLHAHFFLGLYRSPFKHCARKTKDEIKLVMDRVGAAATKGRAAVDKLDKKDIFCYL